MANIEKSKPCNHHPETCNCNKNYSFSWSALQIATYAINCPKEDKYFMEVAYMIDEYSKKVNTK